MMKIGAIDFRIGYIFGLDIDIPRNLKGQFVIVLNYPEQEMNLQTPGGVIIIAIYVLILVHPHVANRRVTAVLII